MVMDINKVLAEAKEILKKNEIDSREARLLLAFSLETTLEKLFMKNEITYKEYKNYMKIIKKRSAGIPYAYITGHKEFMKLDFIVNKNVLIPREDTEILVQEAIKINKKEILDMCTGSGCIAISLALYIENSLIDAVDKSKRALKIAMFNAKKNNANVNFINSNLFEKIEKTYDLIVSNPPYIKTDDLNALQKEVKNEPKMALDGGKSGILFYKKIIKQAKNYLNENGFLLLEIGYDEAEAISNLLKSNNYKNIEIIKDLSKNDRVIKAQK